MDMIEMDNSQLATVSGGYGFGNRLSGLASSLQGLLTGFKKSPTINLNLNLSVIIIANSKIGGNLNILLGQGIYI